MNEEPFIRWDWVGDHLDDLAERTSQHLFLGGTALIIGTVIALVLAAIMRRWKRTIAPITTLTTVLYAIPAVALFAALIPVFGTGYTVPIIALTTYSLVVLTPFFLTALSEVDPASLSAADAMGMSRRQRAVRVEVPLALPGLIAGIRVGAVTTIGLVTVGGLFGLGGYGNLIDDGLTRDFPTPIVLGVIGSVAMALISDMMLAAVGWWAAPWRRRSRQP